MAVLKRNRDMKKQKIKILAKRQGKKQGRIIYIRVFQVKIILLKRTGTVLLEAGNLKNSRKNLKKQENALKKQKKNCLKKHITTGNVFLMRKQEKPVMACCCGNRKNM